MIQRTRGAESSESSEYSEYSEYSDYSDYFSQRTFVSGERIPLCGGAYVVCKFLLVGLYVGRAGLLDDGDFHSLRADPTTLMIPGPLPIPSRKGEGV